MTWSSRSDVALGDVKWPIARLHDVATIERNAVSVDQIQGGEFYVGLENVTSDGVFENVVTAGKAGLKSNKFAFTEDHVLYGKLRPYLAKISAPDFAGICSTDILPIRPGARLDRRYLLHYLRTPTMVTHAASNAVGINLPRLNPKALESFQIPLPPIEEQRRIAAVLDAAETLRAKRRQALATFDTLTRAIFISMFGDPILRSMQLDLVPLGDLLKLKSGQGLSAKAMRPGPHLVYGGNGVVGTHDEYMFEGSKIVIGRVGVYCGCVHISEPRSWITDNALYVSWMSSRLRTTYLAAALDLANLNRRASQAAQPLISGGRIYPVEIPVPPLNSQHVFEERTRAITEHRIRIEEGAEKLNELFASLQQRAFRGEL
ncbi:MAG: restriction endonuclease subunit S [Acidimicrobiaceae bacterium]|nr:restriction endonuclease subunit S [Acidimicrobiaceae bacterium]